MRFARSMFAAGLMAIALTATATARGQVVTSSVMLPFTGLFNPPGASEPVALTGRVHVVTQVAPGDPCQPTDPCIPGDPCTRPTRAAHSSISPACRASASSPAASMSRWVR